MTEELKQMRKMMEDDITEAEESEEIGFLIAQIGVSLEYNKEKVDEIKDLAKDFFKERGIAGNFSINDDGYLSMEPDDEEESDTHEVQVDLQSFMMSLPKSVNPEDRDKIRELAIKALEQKMKDGEVYLDQCFVEEK